MKVAVPMWSPVVLTVQTEGRSLPFSDVVFGINRLGALAWCLADYACRLSPLGSNLLECVAVL